MKKLTFSLLLLICLISLQCNNPIAPSDQLPPITTSGANTFGCKVDGKVYLPYGGINIDGLKVTVFLGNKVKNPGGQIYTRNRKNSTLTDLDITMDFNDTGTYKIYNQLNDGLVYSDGNTSYEPFDTFGIVHISRCDTIQKIISGTFSFEAYTDNTHATKVNITDGRFDLHYPLTIH